MSPRAELEKQPIVFVVDDDSSVREALSSLVRMAEKLEREKQN